MFCLRLTDRNSKVNLHALQAFSSMVPVMHSALVPIINPIMGTLIPNLASRNLTIHSTAMTVLDLLSHHIGKFLACWTGESLIMIDGVYRCSPFTANCGQQQSAWQLQDPANHDKDISK